MQAFLRQQTQGAQLVVAPPAPPTQGVQVINLNSSLAYMSDKTPDEITEYHRLIQVLLETKTAPEVADNLAVCTEPVSYTHLTLPTTPYV